MPRARPGARKTDARRRIQRYRTKWTHHVIPGRVKRLLFEPPHHMWEEWEDEEKSDSPGYVECEEPTMAELEAKGVPEAEWRYYLGYMKRMLALYRKYTGETLQLEKTSLIEEYVLRDKDRDVLEQVQEVTAECAGVPIVPPFTCEDVRACLEGDYSTWAEAWEYDFPDGLSFPYEVTITFSPDYLFIRYVDSASYFRFAIIGVTDASSKFTSPSSVDYVEGVSDLTYTRCFQYNTLAEPRSSVFSVFGRYVGVIRKNKATFEVWKAGVKVWTSPLASDAVVGASTYEAFAIRYDGKYVIAITDTKKLVCFEGS